MRLPVDISQSGPAASLAERCDPPPALPRLVDGFGRVIDYLRISVTDRCNYRCVYCMPPQGVELKPYAAILRYEQIEANVRAAAGLGIRKVRLTGGEPLVKSGIVGLVARIAGIPGVEELSMTTNGSLLTLETAMALKAAGLSRVNISLDTLDPEAFAAMTRGGNLNDVLAGIDAAACAGLHPIKINMVVGENTSVEERERLRQFCAGKGLRLQTIKRFTLERRDNPEGSMAYDRPPRCSACNRLRLTADGHLKPCLFSTREIPIDFNDIAASIREAVSAKPREGQCCDNRIMSQIGG